MVDLFARVTGGFVLTEWDLAQLVLYVGVGDDGEILELIGELAQGYPDVGLAELGFVVVWDALVKGEGV